MPRSPRRVQFAGLSAPSKLRASVNSENKGLTNSTSKIEEEEDVDEEEITVDPTHLDPYLQVCSQ